MASGNGNRSNYFRPHYGNNRNAWSSRTFRGTNQSNSQFNTNGRYREQRQESSRTINYSGQDGVHDSSVSQRIAMDDETTAYAVNLQLKPVEMGVKARNDRCEQNFQGLGAFNHYFGLCAPTNGLGYTLSDIWDGYFHITLAKFFTRLTPDQLEEVFRKFNPSLENLPYIPDIVFQASSIKTGSGRSRPKGRQHIDFVVLPIDYSPETKAFYDKVQSLLGKIKELVESTDWGVTPPDKLHVTVRKYSNINFELDKIKIQQFPLEFRCSHLEVRQPREQAINQVKNSKNKTYKWWTGVTEIDWKCSGCNTTVMSDHWEGFCLACGEYESIVPLWSTTGNKARYHSLQQEQIQDDMQSELVQRITLNES